MSQQVNALPVCKYEKSCSACSLQHMSYAEQLEKSRIPSKLWKKRLKVLPIIGINFPILS